MRASVLMVCAAVCELTAAVGIPTGAERVASSNSAWETEVVTLVNSERAKEGKAPLTMVDSLRWAARYHAADMRDDAYFEHDSHDRISGSLVKVCGWSVRVKKFHSVAGGENIAGGYGSPQAVVTAWMNSSGHRANILGNYTLIGVGYVGTNWVQNFASGGQAVIPPADAPGGDGDPSGGGGGDGAPAPIPNPTSESAGDGGSQGCGAGGGGVVALGLLLLLPLRRRQR